MGLQFFFNHECSDFDQSSGAIQLSFRDQLTQNFDAVGFALGGGSWETEEIPLRWPTFFTSKGLQWRPFVPSNVGYELAWTPAFLKEAEGKALKNIKFSNRRGEQRGDLMVTSYGLEGTPIYSLGEIGSIFIDLKPDLSEQVLLQKLSSLQENLSPLRRANKVLRLGAVAKALLFHFGGEAVQSLGGLVAVIKKFPLELLRARPLTEAISSKGGICWTELDESLALKQYPHVYCLGEMVNWDAPTGGFLIQACVSQGVWCAQHMLADL